MGENFFLYVGIYTVLTFGQNVSFHGIFQFFFYIVDSYRRHENYKGTHKELRSHFYITNYWYPVTLLSDKLSTAASVDEDR